jgi:hypothetical protein
MHLTSKRFYYVLDIAVPLARLLTPSFLNNNNAPGYLLTMFAVNQRRIEESSDQESSRKWSGSWGEPGRGAGAGGFCPTRGWRGTGSGRGPAGGWDSSKVGTDLLGKTTSGLSSSQGDPTSLEGHGIRALRHVKYTTDGSMFTSWEYHEVHKASQRL